MIKKMSPAGLSLQSQGGGRGPAGIRALKLGLDGDDTLQAISYSTLIASGSRRKSGDPEGTGHIIHRTAMATPIPFGSVAVYKSL